MERPPRLLGHARDVPPAAHDGTSSGKADLHAVVFPYGCSLKSQVMCVCEFFPVRNYTILSVLYLLQLALVKQLSSMVVARGGNVSIS